MIERYTTPEMKSLWSEQHKFETWLEVEQAVAQAQAELGIIPREAARTINKASFRIDQIDRFEAETRHDVIAFLRSVETTLGRQCAWLHYGLTSYDIVDTALALRCQAAVDLILVEARKLETAVRHLAVKHKATPMMGRTHGVHAEPITFGLKCLSWYEEIRRNIERLEQAKKTISFGKMSGAVGTFSQISPRVEAAALRRLGLAAEPVATQVVPRDRLAVLVGDVALFGACLERIALEIRNLQRTEISEVSESFAKGQRGSSAMPHKRNPITCEQICGLSRILRANVIVALEDIPLWHERDLTNSSAERIFLPDSLILIHYLLRQATRVIENLHVDERRMMLNLQAAQGQFFSQRLMLALVKAGASKDKAYQLTQEISFRAREEGKQLREVAQIDPGVTRFLKPGQLRPVFDLDSLLTNVDYIFRRSLNK